MVELAELQAIAYVAQVVGVVGTLTAAFIAVRSYLNANKRAEESRKRDLETRQTQLFMQIYDKSTQKEFMQDFIDIIMEWKWTDVNDFETKYMMDVRFQTVSDYFEGIGVLVKRKLIDPELVDDLMSGWITSFWEKTGSVTLEQRRIHNYPQANEHVEFLYNEVKRIAKSQHTEYVGKEHLSWITEKKQG
jgi:hypothetical protein